MEFEEVRKEFPYLSREIKGKRIVYFDNAASTQKPQVVIDSIASFYSNHYANIHRGVHRLSQEASALYEDAHKKVGKLINAPKPAKEIIFTKNTTESINLIAKGLDWNQGDEIIVSEMEHHSNIVPWQMLKEKGVSVRYIPVTKHGLIDMVALDDMISNRTRLISVVHASNFLGTINDMAAIGKLANKNKILFSIDGAQSVPQMPVDVKKLKCDFLSFSGHKMCGPTGVGVLYAKEKLLNSMRPMIGGGDMISKVSYSGFEYNRLPWKFEAGTPNIADGYAMGVAADFLRDLSLKKIAEHEKELMTFAYEEMAKMNNVEIYGPTPDKRGGLISFNIKGMSPHDVAGIMDERQNISLRSGLHCVEPLHKKMGLNSGSVRASFYIYNTHEEVQLFLNELKNIIKTFC